MKNDIVSIVIPTYKRFEQLDRCVMSSVNQTYENLQIIITSDNDEETNKILREKYEKLDTRIKFVANTSGKKCVGNWNNGLLYATGKYIKILYDDDWINLNCIEKCIETINGHEGVFFMCANYFPGEKHSCGSLKEYGSYNLEKTIKFMTTVSEEGFFETCVSPCAYLFKNKNIKFRTDFSNDERIEKWGSGADIIYIIENLLLQIEDRNKCLMCIEDCLGNFDSHANRWSVMNLPEVLKLTKEGMLFAKNIYSHKKEIRFI